MRVCPRCGAIYKAEVLTCSSDSATLVSREDDPLLGSQLGRFILEELVHEGVTGRIYRAGDAAVRILYGDFGSKDLVVRRLMREIEEAKKLEHTQIARILDAGSDDGSVYVATEWADGTTLAAWDGELTLDRAGSFIAQIAAALAEAHQRGQLHRNLSPSNVIVNDVDILKVTDFGLGSISRSSQAIRFRTGRDYAAPEALKPSGATTASDVYSLGLIGRDLLSAAGDGKGDLGKLVTRMIDEDPSARPKTAQAVVDELEALGISMKLQISISGVAPTKELASDLAVDGLVLVGTESVKSETPDVRPASDGLVISQSTPIPGSSRTGYVYSGEQLDGRETARDEVDVEASRKKLGFDVDRSRKVEAKPPPPEKPAAPLPRKPAVEKRSDLEGKDTGIRATGLRIEEKPNELESKPKPRSESKPEPKPEPEAVGSADLETVGSADLEAVQSADIEPAESKDLAPGGLGSADIADDMAPERTRKVSLDQIEEIEAVAEPEALERSDTELDLKAEPNARSDTELDAAAQSAATLEELESMDLEPIPEESSAPTLNSAADLEGRPIGGISELPEDDPEPPARRKKSQFQPKGSWPTADLVLQSREDAQRAPTAVIRARSPSVPDRPGILSGREETKLIRQRSGASKPPTATDVPVDRVSTLMDPAEAPSSDSFSSITGDLVPRRRASLPIIVGVAILGITAIAIALPRLTSSPKTTKPVLVRATGANKDPLPEGDDPAEEALPPGDAPAELPPGDDPAALADDTPVEPERVEPEPVEPEPVKPEPELVKPVKPDPVEPEPVVPDEPGDDAFEPDPLEDPDADVAPKKEPKKRRKKPVKRKKKKKKIQKKKSAPDKLEKGTLIDPFAE